MNKYSCFRPLKIDFIDYTDITSENVNVINDAGYKRRWNLIAYKSFRGISDLNDFISIYSESELKYLPAVGICIGYEDIAELMKTDTYLNKKVFFVIDASEIPVKDTMVVFDNVRRLAQKERLFIRNTNKKVYHSLIVGMHEALKDTNYVMFESDYLDPTSDTGLTYLDINKADLSKVDDLHKYAISTSYSDSIDTLVNPNDDSLTDWLLFRRNGIFNMISFLRNKGLSEQDITECTYGRFCDFIGRSREINL